MNIGDMNIEIPVIQGGMGVGVSLSGLAGAVALAGGVGVISAAQIGFRDPEYNKKPLECNLRALREEIIRAKEIADGGVIGVNIMVVTSDYAEYVKTAVEAGVDIIVSGAGLPMELPGLVGDSDVKLAPIVSGKRALQVILRYWKSHFNRKPDLVVIEGPKAGGHLGFSVEDIEMLTDETYDERIKEIIELSRSEDIPVVIGGGMYERKDLLHAFALGADGVQLATRFVTTYECDAHINYKNAYIASKQEDITIVKSPVGMPGRAIHNKFLDRVHDGERFMNVCRRCITTCKPAETPYCISQALINAVEGRVDEGLLFCGSNAYRASKLEHVSDIMEEFRI